MVVGSIYVIWFDWNAHHLYLEEVTLAEAPRVLDQRSPREYHNNPGKETALLVTNQLDAAEASLDVLKKRLYLDDQKLAELIQKGVEI